MSRCILKEPEHIYRLDGVPVPGTSVILDAGCLVDKAWYTPEGRDRGLRVHAAGHFLCEGDLDWDTVLPSDRGYVHGIERFLRESGFRVEANEFLVWSDHYRFATKPDTLGILGGRRVLINWKTGQVNRPTALQLALEKVATNQRILDGDCPWVEGLTKVNDHFFAEGKYALQLFADGRYKLRPEFTDPGDEPTALGLVYLYHWRLANNWKVAER